MLLGAANGTNTVTIVLAHDVPAAGSLQLAFNCLWTQNSGFLAPTSCVDSNGHAWTISTSGLPLIGLTQENSNPVQRMQVGSVGRACAAGDLHAGDTVTLTFTARTGEVCAAVLVHVPVPFTAVAQAGGGPGIEYFNGDSWPADSFDTSTSLDWSVAFHGILPTVEANAVMVTAMGAYPAVAGFTPYLGTVIGEIATGTVSVAFAQAPVAAHSSPNPGGTWPSARTMLAGNYQFMTAPTLAHAHYRSGSRT